MPSADLSAGTEYGITDRVALKEDGYGPDILHQAKVPLVSKQKCGYVCRFLTTPVKGTAGGFGVLCEWQVETVGCRELGYRLCQGGYYGVYKTTACMRILYI